MRPTTASGRANARATGHPVWPRNSLLCLVASLVAAWPLAQTGAAPGPAARTAWHRPPPRWPRSGPHEDESALERPLPGSWEQTVPRALVPAVACFAPSLALLPAPWAALPLRRPALRLCGRGAVLLEHGPCLGWRRPHRALTLRSLRAAATSANDADSDNGNLQDSDRPSPATSAEDVVTAPDVPAGAVAADFAGALERNGDEVPSGQEAGDGTEDSPDEAPESAGDPEDPASQADRFAADDIRWRRLSPDELTRAVQDLYPKNEDTSQADLLRARAEITRDELTSDADRAQFDVDSEVEKLIEFQRNTLLQGSRAEAKELRKSTGIPGEVVEGPPAFPKLADYEQAHKLHEDLAKRPFLDVEKLAVVVPDVVERERFKEYFSAKNVTRMINSGLVDEVEGKVAAAMEAVVLKVMGDAVKLAEKQRPGLTRQGGALYESMQVFGDLYPTMLVRLTFRHVQYALVCKEKLWTHPEGLRTFAMILKEMGTPVEPVADILHAAVDTFADAISTDVPPDTTHLVLTEHIDMFLTALRSAYDGVHQTKQLTRADFGDGWRDHAAELPLREIWDDPDEMDLNQYLDKLRAEAEADELLAAAASQALYDEVNNRKDQATTEVSEEQRVEDLDLETTSQTDEDVEETEETQETAEIEETEAEESTGSEGPDENSEDVEDDEREDDEDDARELEEARSRRAKAESKAHPFGDPRAWREWAEKTAWEDANGKPKKIEDLFGEMFAGMHGNEDREWLRLANIADDEGELSKKFDRSFWPDNEFPSSKYAPGRPLDYKNLREGEEADDDDVLGDFDGASIQVEGQEELEKDEEEDDLDEDDDDNLELILGSGE